MKYINLPTHALIWLVMILLQSCSFYQADYRGEVRWAKMFGSSGKDVSEVEIACKDRKVRVVGSGSDSQKFDRIENSLTDWNDIDSVASVVADRLDTANKSGFVGGALELGAVAPRNGIKDKFKEVCQSK